MLQYYKYDFWEGFPLDEFEKDLNETMDLPETDVPEQTVPEADVQPEAPAAPETAEVPAADAQPEPAAQPEAPAQPEASAAAPEEAEAVEDASDAAEAAAEAAADAAGEADDAPSTPTGEDGLLQELEGIRDLLQQELDNAQNGELIQELDEVSEEGEPSQEEIPEEELCQCCGERRRDTSFGEDYPYCSECRDLMKAAPLKWSGVLCWILMLVAAGASLVFCAGSVQEYATLMEAETYYANRCISDAEATYYNYVTSAAYSDNYSRSAVKNLIKIFANMGYLNDANDLIAQFFTEAQLKLPWNKRYAAISQEFSDLSAASTKVSEMMQDVAYADDGFDYDKKIAQLEQLAAPGEDGTPGLPEIFVEYYSYALMSLSKQKSDEEMLEQLLHMEEIDDGTHTWLYLTNILSLAARTGNVELTQTYFDKVTDANVQEATAYSALASVYRFTETPDPDKILEAAAQAEENLSASAVPTYLVDRAAAYLLKGDEKSAMDTMEAYMSSGASSGQTPYTVQSCNLYALCCVLTGDDEGYKQMEDVFASAGMEVSKLVKQYQKGKLTLEQVLTDNGGDI